MKHLFDYVLLCICFVSGIVLATSCTNKDLFDQEQWNKMMEKTFPVSGIQTNWQTVGTATANVTVNKDAGEKYTVKLYNSDPLIRTNAVLLAKGAVVSGSTFSTKFDYALADSVVYVACVDSKNRREVIPVHNVTNGSSFNITFGTQSTSSSKKLSYSVTSRASVTLKETPCPYTADQIAYYINRSDAYRISDGDNLASSKISKQNYQTFYIDSNVTKLTGLNNDKFTAQRLIIANGGTFSLNSNIDIKQGVEIIVANGGKLNLGEKTLTSKAYNYALIVMAGGVVIGTGKAYIYVNNSGSMYNNGTMNVPVLYWDAGGVIYNGASGTMNVSNVYMQPSFYYNAYFVNYSPNCHIGDMTSRYHYYIQNSCKMVVDGAVMPYSLTIADGASLECSTLYLTNSITLGEASILKAKTSNFESFDMTGPTSGNPAIFVAGDIYNSSWYAMVRFFNLLYVDYSSYSSSSWFGSYIRFYDGASAVSTGEAPETIPAGDCTCGYTSNPGTPSTDTSLSTTYCFEDNYPKAGDYDFNDAVFDITKSVSDNIVTLAVKLRAVGASVQLKGFLRLYGITSGINSISTDNGFGEGDLQYQATNAGIVIPLFNDAHYALTGSTDRNFYNTMSDGSNTVPTKTLTITINCASADVASNITSSVMDAFINNGSYEIHTYKWKDNAALGKVATGLLSGGYVWAIAVPSTTAGSFKYPYEYQVITGAYPDFEKWVQSQDNTAWYETYDSTKVHD